MQRKTLACCWPAICWWVCRLRRRHLSAAHPDRAARPPAVNGSQPRQAQATYQGTFKQGAAGRRSSALGKAR